MNKFPFYVKNIETGKILSYFETLDQSLYLDLEGNLIQINTVGESTDPNPKYQLIYNNEKNHI